MPAPEQLRDVGSAKPPPAGTAPASPQSAVSVEKGPLSADRLRSLWPSIVAGAQGFLGSLLADTEIRSVSGDTVTLASAGHAEGLTHKRESIGKLIEAWVVGRVTVKVASGSGAGDQRPPDRPVRLTAESAKAERLKVLRDKDPSLGSAVDALDLELME
jgi:hypothetical protein